MYKTRIAGLTLAALALTATSASAQTFVQTTISESTVAPSGVISLPDASSNDPSASQDYTDNATPGQSFTTTTGLNLSGITIEHTGNVGINQPSNIDLRLASVDQTGTLTNIIAVYADTAGIAYVGANTYITFDMTPAGVALAPNTTYYFDIRTLNGYMGWAPSTDTYSGGSGFNGSDGAKTFGTSAPTPTGYERTFVISGTPIVPAPEPSQFAAFGLGLLGLGGLALRARKRSLVA